MMLRFTRRSLVMLVLITAAVLFGTVSPKVNAASANLVWKPYLQQLSSSGVHITWTTKSGSNAVVRYSRDQSYAISKSGSSRTLNTLGTRRHHVTLSGLQANTTYYYRVYTDGANLLGSETLSFRTAPSTGTSTAFSFLAFGDFGKNTDSQRSLRDQMQRDSFRFMVTTGDNAYDAGRYSEFDTKVFQIYRSIFSKAGIFPTLGNHDYSTSSGAPYLDLFSLSTNAWRSSDKERYYSFDFGNVHVVALDSNTPLNVSDSAASNDMLDWLRQDLSQTRQRWKIVALHHSPYSTGSHGSDSRVRSKLVPIFEKYGVDLVLSGHDHIYQRSKPLRNGNVTTASNGGITYVVTGAGSAANYGCGNASWVAVSFCAQSYGLYSRVTANNDRLTIEAINGSGTVKDRLYLVDSTTTMSVPGRISLAPSPASMEASSLAASAIRTSNDNGPIDTEQTVSCLDGVPCSTTNLVAVFDANVAVSGQYTLAATAKTLNANATFHIEIDGVDVTGPMSVTSNDWAEVISTPITIPAGQHTIQLVTEGTSVVVSEIVIALGDGSTSPPPDIDPSLPSYHAYIPMVAMPE